MWKILITILIFGTQGGSEKWTHVRSQSSVLIRHHPLLVPLLSLMMLDDVGWCSMMVDDVRWCSVMFDDVWSCLTSRPQKSHRLDCASHINFEVMFDDVSWCFMMFDDSWCLMMLDEVWWCLVMFDDVRWCLMMLVDAWWCMVVFYDVRWCLMMFDDVRSPFYYFGWEVQSLKRSDVGFSGRVIVL